MKILRVVYREYHECIIYYDILLVTWSSEPVHARVRQ